MEVGIEFGKRLLTLLLIPTFTLIIVQLMSYVKNGVILLLKMDLHPTLLLVFESPVRSGFFDPRGGNRRPDRLFLFNISTQPRTGPA